MNRKTEYFAWQQSTERWDPLSIQYWIETHTHLSWEVSLSQKTKQLWIPSLKQWEQEKSLIAFTGCETWTQEIWERTQRAITLFAPQLKCLFLFLELPMWMHSRLRSRCYALTLTVPSSTPLPNKAEAIASKILKLCTEGRLDLAGNTLELHQEELFASGYKSWFCEIAQRMAALSPTSLSTSQKLLSARYFHLKSEDLTAWDLLKTVPASPSNWEVLFLKSRITLRLSRFEDQIACLQELSSIAESDDQRFLASLEHVNRHILKRDLTSAKDQLEQLKKNMDQLSLSPAYLGLFYFFCGQFHKANADNNTAVENYASAIKSMGDCPLFQYESLLAKLNYCHAQFDRGHWNGLDSELDKLAEQAFLQNFSFLHAGVVTLHSSLWLRIGKTREALVLLQHAEATLEIRDNYFRLLIRHQRCVALRKLGRWNETLPILEQGSLEAKRLGFTHLWAQFLIESSRVQTYLGNFQTAIEILEPVLQNVHVPKLEHQLAHHQLQFNNAFSSGNFELLPKPMKRIQDHEVYLETWDVDPVPAYWIQDFMAVRDSRTNYHPAGGDEPWSSLLTVQKLAKQQSCSPLPLSLAQSPLLEALCQKIGVSPPETISVSPAWAHKAIHHWDAFLNNHFSLEPESTIRVTTPEGKRLEFPGKALEHYCRQHTGLVIDRVRNRVYLGGEELAQLRRHSVLKKLLHYLLQNAARPCPKEKIIASVWERNYNPSTDDPLLYTSMRRLRGMMERAEQKLSFIETSDSGYFLNISAGIWVIDRAPHSTLTDPWSWVEKQCREGKKLSRSVFAQRFSLSESTAKRTLTQWVKECKLQSLGKGRGTYYVILQNTL